MATATSEVTQPSLPFGIIGKEEVPIDSLVPYPGNPRIHDMETIKGSLQSHGQVDAITVNKPTRRILGGNGTWTGMKELGWKTCHVDWVEVDEDEEIALVLILNRAPDLASYDWNALHELLKKAREAKQRKVDEIAGQQNMFDGWDEDAFEDVVARTGQVGAVAIEEFRGDYGVGQAEATEKQVKTASAAARAAGMKEVVLILTTEQYALWVAKIKELMAVWELKSGSEAAVELIRRAPSFRNDEQKGLDGHGPGYD